MKRAFIMILICIVILIFPLSCSTSEGSIQTPMGQAVLAEKQVLASYSGLEPADNGNFYTVKLRFSQPADLDAMQSFLWVPQGNMALQVGADAYPCSHVIYEAPKSDHSNVSVRLLFEVDGSMSTSGSCTITLSDGSTIALP